MHHHFLFYIASLPAGKDEPFKCKIIVNNEIDRNKTWWMEQWEPTIRSCQEIYRTRELLAQWGGGTRTFRLCVLPLLKYWLSRRIITWETTTIIITIINRCLTQLVHREPVGTSTHQTCHFWNSKMTSRELNRRESWLLAKTTCFTYKSRTWR